MSHTILLLQTGPQKGTRKFFDYDNVSSCMSDLQSMFETELKRHNPSIPQLSYEPADLYRWIESLPDVGVLTYAKDKFAYEPHDRAWIVQRIEENIMKSAH